MITIRGRIVTPTGVVDGRLAIDGGRIIKIGPGGDRGQPHYDFGEAVIVPGFIDVHMHGLGEWGVFEVSELCEVACMEPRFGTTGFLPSVASLSAERYLQFGRNVRQAQQEAGPSAARILGAHFEGPFINPVGKGGMEEQYLRPVDPQEYQTYLDEVGDVLKLMTLSPELDGSAALIRLLGDHGVVASLGHSRASKAQLHAAIDAGLSHVCHLYNAFERTMLRDGWQWQPDLLVCVLISDALRCEVNCDMIHVPPEYVMLAIKALGPDRVMAITDSLPGAGLPPGQYTMVDGREFTTRNGVAQLTSNGDIVGSVLTMNKAFANLVEHCGVGLLEAARCTSTNAAASLGVSDRIGSIEVGKQADLAVLDTDYQCIATFVDGEMIYGSGNQTRERNHRDTTDRTA